MAITHAYNQTVADGTATSVVRPSDWNSAHNQIITLAGNTAGVSTVSGTNIVFAAGNEMVLSASQGAGVATISIAEQLGYISFLEAPVALINSATMSVGGGSSLQVAPFFVPEQLSASIIRLPVSMSLASTTFATGAAAYGSSVAQSNTIWVNFYSQGSGANSLSLQYVTGGSATWVMQISYSGTSSTHSVSYNMTYPVSNGVTAGGGTLGYTSTQMTTNQAAGSSAVNEVPAATANFQGARLFDIPFAGTLPAGPLWMAVQRSSTTGGGSNIGLGISAFGITQQASTYGQPGQATNSSNHLVLGLGSWSTNSLGRTTNSIALANVSQQASNPRMYFQLINIA